MTSIFSVETRFTALGLSQPAFSRSALAVPARAVSGETTWRWIAVAFAAYWAVFVAGAFTNQQSLNNIGAVIILGTLGWATLERLWVRIDTVAIACLAAAIIPLLVLTVSGAVVYPDAVVKHVSLYVVMALTRLLRLPPASSTKMRGFFAVQILAILMLSAIMDRGGVYDGGTRHSGLFANPNNLSLVPFLLLFFIDRERDSLSLQVMVHLIVIAVLGISRTSGAVMAYAIGLTVYLRSAFDHYWRGLAVTFLVVGGLAVGGLMWFGGENLLPETRFTNQIVVMQQDLNTVLQGGEVAYYDQERELGSGAASGIWRLIHWRDTLTVYADGTLAQELGGFGIGSTPTYVGKLPHNEYIRVLFEQGLIGFVLFLFAWFRIIRTAPPEVRYCGLILAIYSFSENNLDNFPVMSLFILCLSATGKSEIGLRIPNALFSAQLPGRGTNR